MLVDLGYLSSVAVLALLGTLIARRFQALSRLIRILPIVLAVAIVWVSGDVTDVLELFSQGIASGLLAGGFLFLWRGIDA